MNKSLEIFKKEFGLESTEKAVLVSSRIIANKFSKEHKDILEKIRNLVAENSTVKNMVIEGKESTSLETQIKFHEKDLDRILKIFPPVINGKDIKPKNKYKSKV